MLLADFAPQFLSLATKDGNSAGELAQKRMALRNHIVPELGTYDVANIGVATIREFTAYKVAEGLAPKTINNLLGILARLLHVAQQEGCRTEPLPAIKRLPAHFKEARFLSPDEATALLESARAYGSQFANPAYYFMVHAALHTGLRIGELLALEWGDLDTQKGRLSVQRSWCRVEISTKLPKNGHHRYLNLSAPALAFLQKWKQIASEDTGRIFAIPYVSAHKALARITDLAGLENVGWHTLRHTFASWLITAGVPLFTVSRMLGHQSLRQTERYAHLNDEANRAAAATITTILENV
jgi:integrase